MKNEQERMAELWQEEERIKREKGYQLIAGVDEAGRGPLAGPVYAAAVILPWHAQIPGIDDSKKLTEKKREALFDVIREQAISYGIASVDEKTIDEINILNASLFAMRLAVEQLSVPAEYILIDGNQSKGMPEPCETLVKGDARSMNIAAASILAKVARDRFMRKIAEEYPEYGFSKHKGYGTKAHYEAIQKYGVLPIHRRSFLKKILGETK